ncbi:hypothetical protein [Prevotellamassilia timonensis]|uniref:hypothetical protein n=1 Tax=Prevotellamassilia timonensis TaxID=1852370 RepID=UPI003A8D56C5
MKCDILFLVLIGLCSCACTLDNKAVDIDSADDLNKLETVAEKAAKLGLSSEVYSRMPEKVRGYREASIKLANYVELKGRTFYLTISKQKAKALGVTGEQYDVVVKNLNATNIAIQEAMENGDTLDLSGAIEELRKTISEMK